MQFDLVDGGYLTWLYGSKPFARGNWPPQSVRGAILALDCLEKTFRAQRDESYKANRLIKRVDNPDAYATWQRIRELRRDVVEDPRLNCIRIPGLEADDLIALVAWKFFKQKPLELLAQDKDLLQIRGLKITDNQGNAVDLPRFSARLPKAITRRPLDRMKIPLILALLGDKSDNIPRLVDRGDLWILNRILSHDKTQTRFEDAYDEYGSKFLKNLYAVVLPDPSIFGYNEGDVLELLSNKKWGYPLLADLKPEYHQYMNDWRMGV